MYISNLVIKNFKGLENVSIPFNNGFNFIIGQNNIGKSSVFEAIQLWKLCFDKLIQKNGKAFYSESNIKQLSPEELYFLRIHNPLDLFYDTNEPISIAVEIKSKTDASKIYTLEISIELPSTSNFYLRIHNKSYNDFVAYSEHIKDSLSVNSLKSSIFVYKSRPIFDVVKNEAFYNKAQIEKKIALGKSNEVLRNKIYRGYSKDGKFTNLESNLLSIIGAAIKFKIRNRNTQDEEYLKIDVSIDGGKDVELSMLGSGMLQVIDIFSTFEYINKRDDVVNIFLIDEPDSHMHTNMQARLLQQLRAVTGNQYFIVTHNDRLMSEAEDEELLYLNKEANIVKAHKIPSNAYNRIVAELSSELLQDVDDKIKVITEGVTDKLILETAWRKLYDTPCPFLFISSGTNSVANDDRTGNAADVRRTLEFVASIQPHNITRIKLIGLFDNDSEGYAQFKGLNKKIFETHTFDKDERKHKVQNIYGMVLPVPGNRLNFVTNGSSSNRALVIEHYFSDQLLENANIKGGNIYGSEVFNIKGSKKDFAVNTQNFISNEFEEFKNLFDKFIFLFS